MKELLPVRLQDATYQADVAFPCQGDFFRDETLVTDAIR